MGQGGVPGTRVKEQGRGLPNLELAGRIEDREVGPAGTPSRKPDPRCALRPERGPCKALFTKYHFDSDKQACAPFFYGGCEGVVPFETAEDCEAACGSVAPNNPGDKR